MLPHLKNEIELWKHGFTVIGIDEVGRGAFAGPLCVGGVVFRPTINRKQIIKLLFYGINDSKKLSKTKRELLSKIIQSEALSYHISTISTAEINRSGIGKATFKGIRSVVKHLREKLSSNKIHLLIDKFYVKNIAGVGLKNQQGIIHGDEISLSIAAASIIAKVYRDNHMEKLSAKYPNFDFHKNKGYGTLFHRNAIKKFGVGGIHRTEFVKNYI